MSKIKVSYIFRLVFLGIILFAASTYAVIWFISAFSTITMPDFRGVSFENAKKATNKLDLEIRIENEVYSNVYAEGFIVDQNTKPKTKIKKGRLVYVTVSKGSKMVTVPDIKNLPKARALLMLRNADLEPGYETSVSDSAEENTVLSQSPPPGETVPFNYSVNILVSSGENPKDYIMPDVTGINIFDVHRLLRKKDLFVEKLSVSTDNSLESGIILEQAPAPGYKVNKETPITMIANRQDDDIRLKRRLINIDFRLTGHKSSKFARVNVLSLSGSETVYSGITEPGAPIRAEAAVRGDALAQFFISGRLQSEKEFPAPEADE
ncbi:MAG: PASTA domain-containing protein [Candidatus Goldiibacteriota bacterium]